MADKEDHLIASTHVYSFAQLEGEDATKPRRDNSGEAADIVSSRSSARIGSYDVETFIG
jgi:hypothetical protein